MRAAILLLPLSALAACAQPFEGRVASRLADAGLSRPMAECMAERWVDRLSLLQLQKISDLADNLKDEKGKLTAGRFISRVRQLDDPEIVEVVTKSSVVCALSA
jgi:hypothetical protein